MEKLRNTILIASLVLVGLTIPVRAEMATMDEALTVANNWVTLIIQKKGDWGGAKTAWVDEIKEFKRSQRVIGYFCRVQPKGYIVVSLRKELAPVKAYSATCDLDPECDEGLTDLIKGKMEGILNRIEQEVGPIKSVRTQDLQSILEINYRSSWEQLGGEVESFKMGLESDIVIMNYQGGEPPLLTSSWHQGFPYNRDCPPPPDGDDCTAARCAVGCVATAAAQIMRHWNWPPYGVGSPYNDTYDWRNMPDRVDANSSTAERNAVAELCSEVGIAAGMGYCAGTAPDQGPCGSYAFLNNMESAYENQYRYSTACARQNRPDYTPANWFSLIQGELNVNRPLQYAVIGHSIVCDGWQVVGSQKQYHMNYGWGWDCNTPDGCNTWYALDALHLGGIGEEYMLENIYPGLSLGSVLSPTSSHTYSRNASFPYRYFDRDCINIYTATFAAGQNLQFLPRVKLTSVSNNIRFEGTSSENTRLFSIKGTQSAGINIDDAAIVLHPGGGIRFH